MARGFESKSVEFQQEEAQRRRELKRERPMSAEARVRSQRRLTLELARARAAADLTHAQLPAQREMLKRAIAALDAELTLSGD
jgi:hypothetical protein